MLKRFFLSALILLFTANAYAGESSITVSSDPGSGGKWTDAVLANRNSGVGILISGDDSWSATITLRMSKDGGTTWYPTGDQFTASDAVSANGTLSFFSVANDFVGTKTQGQLHYQAGVDNGDYGSGDITITLWNAE